MALIYNGRRRGPQTHVLIVGVGGYRHLAGHPQGPIMGDPYLYGKLGQLTSPPLSALEMIDVFLGSDPEGWRAPLGTIDALISPHPSNPEPGPVGIEYVNPTAANIKRAFQGWWGRCNRDSGNVAVLYFCGHGIQADEQYFLASDFGADELNPWDNAIAIDATIKGLWHNRAETQCVFVDACREIVPAARTTEQIRAPALATFREDAPTYIKHPLEVRAVAPTERAFAKENTAAYFTTALAGALRGQSAVEDDDTGAWVVSTAGIAAKFHEILAEVAPHRTHTAEPRGGLPTTLYRLGDPPMVAVDIDCDPNEANGVAALSCRSNDDESATYERGAPDVATWGLEVPAGYYTLAATFQPGSGYRDARRSLLASPPRRSPKLGVRQ